MLPAEIEILTDHRAFVREVSFIVLATSSTRVGDAVKKLADEVDGSHVIVHALGALPARREEESLEAGEARELLGHRSGPTPFLPVADHRIGRVSEILRRETAARRVGALAGPALPRDLVEGRPAAMVVASRYQEVIDRTRQLLGVSRRLRVYGNRDLLGVEMASALSGAMTVAVGLLDGLELGASTRALLITRAVAEMARLGRSAGAQEHTFSGLAGLGNLLVRTSPPSSEHSDDYRLGRRLASAESPAGGHEPRMTEGARVIQAALELSRFQSVRLPILETLSRVLDGSMSLAEAVDRLLTRLPPDEGG